MTLEQALKQIKEQHNADLLTEKDRVIALLSDYLPGDGETKKIRNRTKWVYEQGAIRALADTPDHALGRNKAINIMKNNTDLQETAIEETINAFCIAMGWNSAVPPKQNAQPAPAPVQQPKPAPAPVQQPKPAPAPVQQPKPAPAVVPTPAITPKPAPLKSLLAHKSPVFTSSSHIISVKTPLVNDILDYVAGNKTVDASVQHLARKPRSPGKWWCNLILHLVVEAVVFLCIHMLTIGNADLEKQRFFFFAICVFCLWECFGAGWNMMSSFKSKAPGILLAILLGGAITVVYFINPEVYGGPDSWESRQILFLVATVLGHLGRFVRIFAGKAR